MNYRLMHKPWGLLYSAKHCNQKCTKVAEQIKISCNTCMPPEYIKYRINFTGKSPL